MKINFRQGFERLFLGILAVSFLIAILLFGANGFVFDNSKYVSEVQFEVNNKRIPIDDFLKNEAMEYNFGEINEYLGEIEPYDQYDFECHPYKQMCKITSSDEIFYNGKSYSLTLGNKKMNFIFRMPSLFFYACRQSIDFCLLILYFFAAYLLYEMFASGVCWIVEGFKK